MKALLFILCIVIAAGCKRSKLAETINHTSSFEITFYDWTGKEIGIYKTNFSGEINMLNKYFTGDEVPQYKCGYSGKLILRGIDTTEVDFSLENQCQHISFLKDGIVYSEDISLEGISYFKKLRFKVESVPPLPTDSVK